jgi:hypothetical protein
VIERGASVRRVHLLLFAALRVIVQRAKAARRHHQHPPLLGSNEDLFQLQRLQDSRPEVPFSVQYPIQMGPADPVLT